MYECFNDIHMYVAIYEHTVMVQIFDGGLLMNLMNFQQLLNFSLTADHLSVGHQMKLLRKFHSSLSLSWQPFSFVSIICTLQLMCQQGLHLHCEYKCTYVRTYVDVVKLFSSFENN